ncbi:hypothetical protein Bca4012_010356 [Brassica carinata]
MKLQCHELEAPVSRVCGLDTPFPLVFEEFYTPTKNKASSCSSSPSHPKIHFIIHGDGAMVNKEATGSSSTPL